MNMTEKVELDWQIYNDEHGWVVVDVYDFNVDNHVGNTWYNSGVVVASDFDYELVAFLGKS